MTGRVLRDASACFAEAGTGRSPAVRAMRLLVGRNRGTGDDAGADLARAVSELLPPGCCSQ